MAYKIRWTTEAESTFDSIIEYLERRWTDREIINFVNKTNHLLDQIAYHPEMFRSSGRKKIRVGHVSPQTSLFYQINYDEKQILLLSFWDNRKDPAKRNF